MSRRIYSFDPSPQHELAGMKYIVWQAHKAVSRTLKLAGVVRHRCFDCPSDLSGAVRAAIDLASDFAAADLILELADRYFRLARGLKPFRHGDLLGTTAHLTASRYALNVSFAAE